MPNIARSSPQAITRSPAGKTKILLVRQPVKSVRKSDEPDRAMFKLMLGVIITLGVFLVLWMMGFLGYRLGFASMVRSPELVLHPVDALAAGALMLISIPFGILQAGIEEPMSLMIGFVLISIPAASLGAIKPRSPGGPKLKPGVIALFYAGAIVGGLNALGILWWMISPLRLDRMHDLPLDPSQVRLWLTNLQTVAGLDVLALVAAALWVVVVMRLAIPRWLRGLTASICFIAGVLMLVATSISNVAIAELTAGRSVCHAEDGREGEELILGFTPQYLATLRVENQQSLVDWRDKPTILHVLNKQSIVEFVDAQAPKER